MKEYVISWLFFGYFLLFLSHIHVSSNPPSSQVHSPISTPCSYPKLPITQPVSHLTTKYWNASLLYFASNCTPQSRQFWCSLLNSPGIHPLLCYRVSDPACPLVQSRYHQPFILVKHTIIFSIESVWFDKYSVPLWTRRRDTRLFFYVPVPKISIKW